MFFNIGESKVKTGSGVVTPEREASFPFRLFTFGVDDFSNGYTFYKNVEDAENAIEAFGTVDDILSGTGIRLDSYTARDLLIDDFSADEDFWNDEFFLGNFSNVYSGTSDNYLVRRHSDGHYSYYSRRMIPVDIKGEGYSSSAYTTYSYNPNSNYALIRYGYLENIEHFEYCLGRHNISTPDAILFAAVAYSGDHPAGVTMLGTMDEGTIGWRDLPRNSNYHEVQSATLCEINANTGEVVKVVAGGLTWSSQHYGDSDIVIEKGKCYCLFNYNSSYSDVNSSYSDVLSGWEYGWQNALGDSGFQTTFEM